MEARWPASGRQQGSRPDPGAHTHASGRLPERHLRSPEARGVHGRSAPRCTWRRPPPRSPDGAVGCRGAQAAQVAARVAVGGGRDLAHIERRVQVLAPQHHLGGAATGGELVRGRQRVRQVACGRSAANRPPAEIVRRTLCRDRPQDPVPSSLTLAPSTPPSPPPPAAPTAAAPPPTLRIVSLLAASGSGTMTRRGMRRTTASSRSMGRLVAASTSTRSVGRVRSPSQWPMNSFFICTGGRSGAGKGGGR
jgi:hypothetical protein